MPVVPPVESSSIACEDAPHYARYWATSRANQQMYMIRQDGPSKYLQSCAVNLFRDPTSEILSIIVRPKNQSLLDATSHYVVKDPGSI
jgi:hypothetical protein